MNTLIEKFQKQDDFKQGLIVSFGIHAIILLVFTVKVAFFQGEKIDYEAAVRVDLVALPDKIDFNKPPPALPEENKPEAKDTAKPEPVKPKPEPKAEPKEPTVASPDLKKKQKDALAKLKAMDALEKLKQEAQKDSAASASTKKQSGTQKVKGNVLSAGTELTGLNRLQHEQYIVTLDRHIKQFWAVPEWLANKNYKAQIRIHIDEKGRIISKQLVKSSGNPSYDDVVKATIDKSDPFPPPPDKFVDIVSVSGILIGFPE